MIMNSSRRLTPRAWWRLPGAMLLAVAMLVALVTVPWPARAADLIPVTIALTTDRTVVDPEHPTVTISGKVTGQRPGEEPHPLPGRTVRLQGHWQTSPWEVVTDADGAFTTTWSPGQYGLSVEARVDGTGEYAAASATTPSISKVVAKTRLTMTPDRPVVNQGERVTVQGLVEWESAAGWRAVAGANVRIVVGDCNPGSRERGAVTGPHGRFQITVTAACDTGVSAQALHPSYLYEQAEGWLPKEVVVRPKVDLGLRGTMSVWGDVHLTGYIHSRQPAGHRSYDRQPIRIEVSPNGRTGWRTFRTVRVNFNDFSLRFSTNHSAYWRARYAGTANTQPAVSNVRKLWRWGTRMSKMKVSPTRVRKNNQVTVSGTLTRYYNLQQPKPTPFPKQRVRIIFRFKGKKQWYHLAFDTTDSKGRYSKRVPAYGDAYFAAVFEGTRDTWAVSSPNTPYVDTYGSASTTLNDSLGPVVDAPSALPWRGGPAQAALTPEG